MRQQTRAEAAKLARWYVGIRDDYRVAASRARNAADQTAMIVQAAIAEGEAFRLQRIARVEILRRPPELSR